MPFGGEWKGQAVGRDQGEGRSKEQGSRWSWGLGQVGAVGMQSNELMNHSREVGWTGFAGKAGGWGVQEAKEPWGQGSGEWGEVQLLVWVYCHGRWDYRVMVSSALNICLGW